MAGQLTPLVSASSPIDADIDAPGRAAISPLGGVYIPIHTARYETVRDLREGDTVTVAYNGELHSYKVYKTTFMWGARASDIWTAVPRDDIMLSVPLVEGGLGRYLVWATRQ